MDYLLNDSNEEYFDEKFPVIYRTKNAKSNNQGYYVASAIDNALKNNQVKAVNLMIDYIVKYQNNFVSSYLFQKILPILMEKDISI